jgi:chorismate mutase
MDIEDWRKKIDELDRKLVELLSERARAAVEIGRLKRNTSLPIYEPDRERIVFANVQELNPGPLPGRDLVRIYERIIDVMRNIQKEEIVTKGETAKTRNRSLAAGVLGRGRARDEIQPVPPLGFAQGRNDKLGGA